MKSTARMRTTPFQSKLSTIFPEPPVLAFRRPKSLKDLLVRADLSFKSCSSFVGPCKGCGNKRCLTCKHILNTQAFNSHSTGTEYTIFCNVNCKTKNAVYLLQCKCGKHYVGESEQPFHKRLNGHCSDYECKPDLPLSRDPLRSPGHTQADLNRLTITIIDHNTAWSWEDILARERFWIRKLNTLAPNGINEKWTQEARRNQLEDELQQLFETHSGLKHLEFKPLIFVDATNPEDPEIVDLRERLMQRATEHPRWGESMPTRWIPLELQLAQKSAEGTNIISRDQLLALNSKNESMVLSDRQIETFLKVQHSLGKLLYFDLENLRHFIIISPAYLVEVLRSIVREIQFWPKGEMFSRILSNLQETGMIERNDIYFLWEQDDFNQILPYKEYMIQILVHLDVIIAPRTSFGGVNIPINDVSRFMVPCMVTKGNDTMYLKKFRNSNNSIILAYSFTEQVIPPALSYRFLSCLITSWDIKNYKGRNREKRMFFSDLAIVTIDSSHDVAVQVETNRVIVSLIHAKTKEDIIPTLASSLQECLTAAIVRISEFYSVLSEDVTSANASTVLPFNIEFGVFCKSKMCFFDHNEIPLSTDEAVWICKKHKQRHATKNLSAWFSSKEPCNVCKISCDGLGRLESEQCPLPQHIVRLAARLSPVEIREIAILLGFQAEEWHDLEHQFQHQTSNDLKFMALWSSILKRKNCSFHDLKNVLEDKGLSAHLLCQVFRDVVIDVSDMADEKLNKIPSVDALHDLSNHIGNSTMQLAIELEVDLSYLQQIQHDLKNKLLEQNRKVFIKWRQNKFPKPTVLRLLKALYRVGKFGPTFKVLKNHLE